MMNMRRYKIPVIFEFAGAFSIEAPSLAVARQCAQHHCGLTIGTVHSTLPPDQVDWSFSCHPTKKVGKGYRCDEQVIDHE
ncbi:MAG: hypothetical protein EOM37_11395 [Proteobacteria bacterium]|nr:hypothetical protein [Pseudomonadota bacterium]